MPLIQQRLQYSGTNIDYTKLVDTLEMGDLDHIIHKDKSGGTVIYRRSETVEFDVDVICSEQDADTYIRLWIELRYTLNFFENFTDSPGSSITVKIMNPTFPMRRWSKTKWRGTLSLRKI